MKVKVTYLDADNKKATKEDAEWKIIAEYDEEGNLQKEAWINLKKKRKKKEDLEKKDEKIRKYIMKLDKRILIVSKQATFQGHKGRWVTLEGGQKVFIREGESLSDAIGRLKPPEKLPKAPKALILICLKHGIRIGLKIIRIK